MINVLVDTSVLIQIWRVPGSRPKLLDSSKVAINTVSLIEFLQGANLKQRAKAKIFLSEFSHVRLGPATCDVAVELIDKHSHAGGLRLADALIAATCLEHNSNLLTLNRRHFEDIQDLKLI